MSSQSDIAAFIQQTPLVDTHEHMKGEATYLEENPDILRQLFQNYVPADLFVAGATQEAVENLCDPSDPDVAARFAPIQEAWARVQHTGYGEAVSIIAKDLYGIDELTPDSIAAAQEKNAALVQPGERLRLLRDEANLDHIQTDAKSMTVRADLSGPDFFFYDISWVDFCSGRPNHEEIAQHTGQEVSDLYSLQRVMETIFASSSSPAIAVKSQHAYNRTLRWKERSRDEAAKALEIYLRDGEDLDEAARLCLGDWCWARGVELCIEHDLPMKIHTGYYAGHSRMPVDYIRSGNLCPLLAKYPEARFVLMHIAYPYTEELVALAKHYPNVYADLCWAWSINPYSSMEFVRRFIHAAPANKLFLYGGDTGYPGAALAYAKQARTWFTRVMQAEISEGFLTEAQAIDLARRYMRDNQYECFRADKKKETLRRRSAMTGAEEPSRMADSRPNIILIITDQQRFDTIAALGFDYMETPNLDRLVHEGVSFTNCHITAPSCAPARASLFTGYYPHTTGILKNGDRWTSSWVEDLSASGYHCVNVGKMHTSPFETPLGFHERYVVENKDRYLEGRYYFDEWDKALRARGQVKQQRVLYRQRDDYNESLGAFDWELPEDLHSDMFVGDFATWWVRNKPRPDGPLFLQVGFPGPHPPYDPTPRFSQDYLDKDLPIQAVTEEELAGQPPPFREMRVHNSEVDHDSVMHLLDPSPQQRHRQRAYYMANVSMIDEKVGDLLAALDEQGYLENAVIIFTSDHGDCLGDHGHSQKWTMYDIITRVPTIVWAPGRITGGRTLDQLCSLFDLGPTILELAGLETPEDFAAESLLPALAGENWPGRETVFAEHCRDGLLPAEYMSMARTKDWKLVHFVGETYGQLFDLVNDPEEVNNLWDNPAHADRKEELLQTLLTWRIRSGLTAKDWAINSR